MRTGVMILGVLVLAAGCASAPPVPIGPPLLPPPTSVTVPNDSSMNVTQQPVSVCLPPGVPPLSTLARIGGVPAFGRAQRSDGQFEPIRLFRSYWARHVEDQDPILFINAANGHIATVDTEVLNPDAPYWYDTGMVNADGYYIPDGRPSCHWKRAGTREDDQT